MRLSAGNTVRALHCLLWYDSSVALRCFPLPCHLPFSCHLALPCHHLFSSLYSYHISPQHLSTRLQTCHTIQADQAQISRPTPVDPSRPTLAALNHHTPVANSFRILVTRSLPPLHQVDTSHPTLAVHNPHILVAEPIRPHSLRTAAHQTPTPTTALLLTLPIPHTRAHRTTTTTALNLRTALPHPPLTLPTSSTPVSSTLVSRVLCSTTQTEPPLTASAVSAPWLLVLPPVGQETRWPVDTWVASHQWHPEPS